MMLSTLAKSTESVGSPRPHPPDFHAVDEPSLVVPQLPSIKADAGDGEPTRLPSKSPRPLKESGSSGGSSGVETSPVTLPKSPRPRSPRTAPKHIEQHSRPGASKAADISGRSPPLRTSGSHLNGNHLNPGTSPPTDGFHLLPPAGPGVTRSPRDPRYAGRMDPHAFFLMSDQEKVVVFNQLIKRFLDAVDLLYNTCCGDTTEDDFTAAAEGVKETNFDMMEPLRVKTQDADPSVLRDLVLDIIGFMQRMVVSKLIISARRLSMNIDLEHLHTAFWAVIKHYTDKAQEALHMFSALVRTDYDDMAESSDDEEDDDEDSDASDDERRGQGDDFHAEQHKKKEQQPHVESMEVIMKSVNDAIRLLNEEAVENDQPELKRALAESFQDLSASVARAVSSVETVNAEQKKLEYIRNLSQYDQNVTSLVDQMITIQQAKEEQYAALPDAGGTAAPGAGDDDELQEMALDDLTAPNSPVTEERAAAKANEDAGGAAANSSSSSGTQNHAPAGGRRKPKRNLDEFRGEVRDTVAQLKAAVEQMNLEAVLRLSIQLDGYNNTALEMAKDFVDAGLPQEQIEKLLSTVDTIVSLVDSKEGNVNSLLDGQLNTLMQRQLEDLGAELNSSLEMLRKSIDAPPEELNLDEVRIARRCVEDENRLRTELGVLQKRKREAKAMSEEETQALNESIRLQKYAVLKATDATKAAKHEAERAKARVLTARKTTELDRLTAERDAKAFTRTRRYEEFLRMSENLRRQRILVRRDQAEAKNKWQASKLSFAMKAKRVAPNYVLPTLKVYQNIRTVANALEAEDAEAAAAEHHWRRLELQQAQKMAALDSFSSNLKIQSPRLLNLVKQNKQRQLENPDNSRSSFDRQSKSSRTASAGQLRDGRADAPASKDTKDAGLPSVRRKSEPGPQQQPAQSSLPRLADSGSKLLRPPAVAEAASAPPASKTEPVKIIEGTTSDGVSTTDVVALAAPIPKISRPRTLDTSASAPKLQVPMMQDSQRSPDPPRRSRSGASSPDPFHAQEDTFQFPPEPRSRDRSPLRSNDARRSASIELSRQQHSSPTLDPSSAAMKPSRSLEQLPSPQPERFPKQLSSVASLPATAAQLRSDSRSPEPLRVSMAPPLTARGDSNHALPPRGDSGHALPPRADVHSALPPRAESNHALPPRADSSSNLSSMLPRSPLSLDPGGTGIFASFPVPSLHPTARGESNHVLPTSRGDASPNSTSYSLPAPPLSALGRSTSERSSLSPLVPMNPSTPGGGGATSPTVPPKSASGSSLAPLATGRKPVSPI